MNMLALHPATGPGRSAGHHPAGAWRGMRRVLAVRLDGLGALLTTTPALTAVRDSLPGAELTLLTSPAAATAAPHLEMVDHVWHCQMPWTKGAQAAGSNALGRAEAELVDRVAEVGFDGALIFTASTHSALRAALLCRMAGIPLRAAHSRENPVGLLTDWVPDSDQVLQGGAQDGQHTLVRHDVLRQLALCNAVGLHTQDDQPRFRVFDSDRRRVVAQLHAAGIPRGAPYALLHPGTTAAASCRPAGQFGVAARQLLNGGCAVVVAGSNAERPLADDVLRASGWPLRAAPPGQPAAVSMAGWHTLGEFAALVAGADVVVHNHSATAQLAAAVGSPVVDLHAFNAPQHTPWPAMRAALRGAEVLQ